MVRQDKKKYKYRFTVFTPTFNRAYVLKGVFDSLMKQTFKDFEWLIVDDGSHDETKELVEKFISKSWFPIRYLYKKNGGKHTAFNRGVKKAKGELFLSFDSDDTCRSNALERFNYHWENIVKEGGEDSFTGVTSLCSDKKGNIIGDRFPEDVFDCNSIERHFKYKISGEKWGFHQTRILVKFPFKEFKNEKFITENTVWFEISKYYQTRYINEILREYEIGKDSLSNIKDLFLKNPLGTYYTYRMHLELDISFANKFKSMVNCSRHCFVNKNMILDCIGRLSFLSFIIFPISFIFIIKDKFLN